jgi:hypothetical protein
MRPVPYELHRNSRRLAIRAIIHLSLAGAAAAVTDFLPPKGRSADGDASTAVTLLTGLASFLIWCVVVLSVLTIIAFLPIEA